MPFVRSLASVVVGAGLFVGALSGSSQAQRKPDAQVCSLGSAAVGQPGTLLCKDLRSGATVQAIPLGPTVSAAGGIAASLAGRDDRVLVTNQANGAILFRVVDGRVKAPLHPADRRRGLLSGALGRRRRLRADGHHAAVLSPRSNDGHQRAASSSVAMVRRPRSRSRIDSRTSRRRTVRSRRSRWAMTASSGRPSPVSGISPGVIVGITGLDRLVVAPIAHLASNPNQAEISVARRGSPRCSASPPRRSPPAGPPMTTARCASPTRAA